MKLDTTKSIKFLLFGLAMAISVNVITEEKLPFEQLLMVAFVASFIYAVNDFYIE
jgi:hypothetical protein